MVFFEKNILIPNVAEKNILILVEEKKKSNWEFLSYILMLNSGKKISRLQKFKLAHLLLLWKVNSSMKGYWNYTCYNSYPLNKR